MNFTNSPYEKIMKEKPKPINPTYPKVPKGTPCEGCPIGVELSAFSVFARL